MIAYTEFGLISHVFIGEEAITTQHFAVIMINSRRKLGIGSINTRQIYDYSIIDNHADRSKIVCYDIVIGGRLNAKIVTIFDEKVEQTVHVKYYYCLIK